MNSYLNTLTLFDVNKSEIIVKNLINNQNKQHDSCFKSILSINDLMIKKKCIQMTNLFFMINENKFIHLKCNDLIIEHLKVFQDKEKEIVWNGLMNYIQITKKAICVNNSLLLQTTVNEMYNSFNVVGKFSSFLKCNFCNRAVKSGHEENHLLFCKEKECNFVHIDNVKCNSKKHKNKFHLNFLSINDILNIVDINQNIIYIIKQNLFKKNNNCIVIKSDSIEQTLFSIKESFHYDYRIISKKCVCIHKFKCCNCFLQIINNCETNLYLKRKRKNIYYGMKDLKSNKFKLISIILIDYSLSELESVKSFNINKNIRKCNNFKVVFLTKDDNNLNFVNLNILEKQNISYHYV